MFAAPCPGCQKKITGRNRENLQVRALKHLQNCGAAKRLAVASHGERQKRRIAVAALVAGLSGLGCLAWFLGLLPA